MVRHALISVALVLASAAVGCGGTVSTSTEPPATADTATTRAPVAVNAHGRVKLFGEALSDVALTAVQRAAIERLASDSEARHAQSRAAHADFLTALATQVEAGAVDSNTLEPKLAAIAAAVQAAQPADRAAFEQLHAVLTPDQRSAFVDAVQAHVGQHVAQIGDKHPLHHWAEILQLSDEQKAQIRSAMEARLKDLHGDVTHGERGAKHQGEAVMAAFKQDTFVFDQVSPPKDVGSQVNLAVNHLVTLAEVAVPLLTPAQRTVAAQALRERAAMPETDGAEF